ncbi:MAG: hypothetical protein ACP5KW_07630 [Thermoproteota archaeon]
MSSPKKLILATSHYDLTRMSSIMAAKMVSMQLGVQLEIVDENWLLERNLKPYLPSFMLELLDGKLLVLRVGGLLNYLELSHRLMEEVQKLNLSSRTLKRP